MPKTLSPRTHKPEHFFILGSQAKLPFPLPERVTVWKPSELNAAVPKAPNRAFVHISYGLSFEKLNLAQGGFGSEEGRSI